MSDNNKKKKIIERTAKQEEKIQIVAFSTNENDNQTPNDILNMFLENNNHQILKKSRHSIAFSTTLSNTSETKKIMICSILNLTREYTGITDVNCYIIFIDLEKEDSKEKFNSIINYAKDYCELSKKIYVLGMISGTEEKSKCVDKDDIVNYLDNAQVTFEYKEINLSKAKEVSDTIMEILVYSSQHSISDDEVNDKDGKKDGSCEIF